MKHLDIASAVHVSATSVLSLYEQQLNRAVQKNLALLQSLQTARKGHRESDLKQAASLLQLSEMKGLKYEPAKPAQAQVRCAANSGQDGFYFRMTKSALPSTATAASSAPPQPISANTSPEPSAPQHESAFIRVHRRLN